MADADRIAALAGALETLRHGDAKDAEAMLREMLAALPDDAVAQANLGAALHAQRRYGEAEAAYRRAIALDPRHAEAHYNLGAVLLLQGHHQAAGHSLREAIAHGGGKPQVRARAVQARMVADLSAPELVRGDTIEALLARGLALREQGLAPAAIDCFHRVLALHPTHGIAAYFAGEQCVWSGRVAEARHDLSVAIGWICATWQPLPEPPPLKRFDRAAAKQALFGVLDAMAAAGIPCFLNGGTALGCVREGDFISFDSDVDVGVPPGADAGAIIDAIEAQPGIAYLYHDLHQDQVLRVRFGSDGGVSGDVFLYQRTGPDLWCGVQRGPLALRWRDTPFGIAKIDFLGRRVGVPDPVERYLEENYGPGWVAPDPNHIPGFSAPNLMDPASGLSRVTIYLSLLGAMSRGDPAQAARYCREACVRFPDDAMLAATLIRIEERLGSP